MYERLSKRELTILHHLAEGYKGREIAEELFVSHETVKTHVKNLYAKLGAKNAPHAVSLGYRNGLLDLEG